MVCRPGFRRGRGRRPGDARTRAGASSAWSTWTWPGPCAEDQVDALHGAAEQVEELDLSAGGYQRLVVWWVPVGPCRAGPSGRVPCRRGRRPGNRLGAGTTPITPSGSSGVPRSSPEAYQRSSLLPLAPGLRRPLLLVHGLSDDNVYVAHTLALSSALLAAGRAHCVLPLPGITHVAGRDDVAERLLLAQVDFLRGALSRAHGP